MSGGGSGRIDTTALLDEMRQRDTPPPKCRRHGDQHNDRCQACIHAFVAGVAWLLVHPGQTLEPEGRPRLDPTPCGICGAVIGEGLMTLHIDSTHPARNNADRRILYPDDLPLGTVCTCDAVPWSPCPRHSDDEFVELAMSGLEPSESATAKPAEDASASDEPEGAGR